MSHGSNSLTLACSVAPLAFVFFLSLTVGGIGGCACCEAATCSSSCIQQYNVAIQTENGVCAALSGACIAAAEADFSSPPWSTLTCWAAYQSGWICENSDCSNPVHIGTGPEGDFDTFDQGVENVQSTVNSGLWDKTQIQITGPCPEFCVEWDADGTTSYVQYGPIASGATLVILPIAGNNVNVVAVVCAACT